MKDYPSTARFKLGQMVTFGPNDNYTARIVGYRPALGKYNEDDRYIISEISPATSDLHLEALFIEHPYLRTDILWDGLKSGDLCDGISSSGLKELKIKDYPSDARFQLGEKVWCRSQERTILGFYEYENSYLLSSSNNSMNFKFEGSLAKFKLPNINPETICINDYQNGISKNKPKYSVNDKVIYKGCEYTILSWEIAEPNEFYQLAYADGTPFAKVIGLELSTATVDVGDTYPDEAKFKPGDMVYFNSQTPSKILGHSPKTDTEPGLYFLETDSVVCSKIESEFGHSFVLKDVDKNAHCFPCAEDEIQINQPYFEINDKVYYNSIPFIVEKQYTKDGIELYDLVNKETNKRISAVSSFNLYPFLCKFKLGQSVWYGDFESKILAVTNNGFYICSSPVGKTFDTLKNKPRFIWSETKDNNKCIKACEYELSESPPKYYIGDLIYFQGVEYKVNNVRYHSSKFLYEIAGHNIEESAIQSNPFRFEIADIVRYKNDDFKIYEALTVDGVEKYIIKDKYGLSVTIPLEKLLEHNKYVSSELENDFIDASYRVAALKLAKVARSILISVISTQDIFKSNRKNLIEIISSKIGLGVVSAVLGYTLTHIPQLKNLPRAQRLAREFRVGGLAKIGDEVIDQFAEFLLPLLNQALEQPAELEVIENKLMLQS